MKVWAYETCFCEYETGYSVTSLHLTERLANEAMRKDKQHNRVKYDGYRVTEWNVEEGGYDTKVKQNP